MRVFRAHWLEVFHKPTNSLQSRLTHIKDTSDTGKKCGTVYHIQCSECEEDYIGETERALRTRLKEHQTSLSSAVQEHLLELGHGSSLSDTAILDSESNFTKKKVKGAIEIGA